MDEVPLYLGAPHTVVAPHTSRLRALPPILLGGFPMGTSGCPDEHFQLCVERQACGAACASLRKATHNTSHSKATRATHKKLRRTGVLRS